MIGDCHNDRSAPSNLQKKLVHRTPLSTWRSQASTRKNTHLWKMDAIRLKSEFFKNLNRRHTPVFEHNRSSKILSDDQIQGRAFHHNRWPIFYIGTGISHPSNRSQWWNETIRSPSSHRALVAKHRISNRRTKGEQNNARELRNNVSTVVLPADKGRARVIMDRWHYPQKDATLLNDNESYRRLSTNHSTTTNSINTLLDKLSIL